MDAMAASVVSSVVSETESEIPYSLISLFAADQERAAVGERCGWEDGGVRFFVRVHRGAQMNAKRHRVGDASGVVTKVGNEEYQPQCPHRPQSRPRILS